MITAAQLYEAADNKALDIGTAWNLLRSAADALERAAELREHLKTCDCNLRDALDNLRDWERAEPIVKAARDWYHCHLDHDGEDYDEALRKAVRAYDASRVGAQTREEETPK